MASNRRRHRTSLTNSGTPQPGVPWSIFQQGGGTGSAATWADDALREIGAPLTPGNEQFIYDWEVSEGGGGWYNPLNEGDDPSNPNLTLTGAQYGGGAANYKSYSAGLQGYKDYLNMPNYSGIRDSLAANDPATARSDLINSPWAASHYGGGSAFSNAPLPGKKSALKGTAGTVDQYQTTSIISSLKGFGTVVGDITSADFWERGALIGFGVLLILIGIIVLALPGASKVTGEAASTLGAAKRIGGIVGGSSGDSGGPTEEEKADRQRRLELAERNADIGQQKVENVRKREERLSLGKPKKQHTDNREPNPNPAHS